MAYERKLGTLWNDRQNPDDWGTGWLEIEVAKRIIAEAEALGITDAVPIKWSKNKNKVKVNHPDKYLDLDRYKLEKITGQPQPRPEVSNDPAPF